MFFADNEIFYIVFEVSEGDTIVVYRGNYGSTQANLDQITRSINYETGKISVNIGTPGDGFKIMVYITGGVEGIAHTYLMKQLG